MGIFDKIQRYEKDHNLGELSIMELVTTYIDENDLELEDVADELKKDKHFTKLFQSDLIDNNEATFEGLKKTKAYDGWM